jgi:ABC-type amino acid transport system permease subunit
VGSYDFDNYEFSGGGGNTPVGVLMQTGIDDDYQSMRHNLWLATDAAYKQAVETIAIAMAVYLTISLCISLFMNWYNRRTALVER